MFIAIIGEQARQLAQDNDLYASVMIAQAILESGSGNSKLAQAPNFNLFGIKGFYEGDSVVMRTTEYDSHGEPYTLLARFRAYDGYADSLADYADLLANGLNGFYSGAWKSNAETPAEACDFLEGRYATSPTYSEKLQDLIATYDLERFDKPLKWEYVDTYEKQAVDPETGELMFDEENQPIMEECTVADLLSEIDLPPGYSLRVGRRRSHHWFRLLWPDAVQPARGHGCGDSPHHLLPVAPGRNGAVR